MSSRARGGPQQAKAAPPTTAPPPQHTTGRHPPSVVITTDDTAAVPPLQRRDSRLPSASSSALSSSTDAQRPQHASSPSSPSLWFRLRREVASWQRGTVSIHDVDVWLRFNVYIRRGFRHRQLRKREALGSLFLYLHNETFNVFSHLVAALVMLSLLLWPLRAPASGGDGGGIDVYGGSGVASSSFSPSSPAWSASEGRAWRPSAQREGNGGGGRQEISVQTPSWLLRSLHGLDSDAAASSSSESLNTAASDGTLGSRVHVPPSSAAPARDVLPVAGGDSYWWWSSSSPASLSSSGWLATFFFLLSSSRSASPVLDGNARPPISVAARLAFSLGPLSWCLCLTFVLSCTYHTFMPCCRSRRGYQQLLQCDVMGVLLSIGGSAYTYLTCGMPCASATTVLVAAVLAAAATLLCLYLVVLAPMWDVLSEGCHWVWAAAQGAAARGLGRMIEYATGGPLPVLSVQQQQQQRFPGRRPRGEAAPLPQSGGISVVYRTVLRWVHQHRHSGSAGAADSSDGGAHSSPHSPTTAARLAEPVHVSAHQRAAVMGVYCLLHLGLYRFFVVPKSYAAHGGFTQGVYYHNWSYLCLFLGGAINAARFPEKVIFQCTRAAAQHTRHSAAEEAARWCAEELAADSGAVPPAASPPPSWWHRFSFSKFIVTYVVSASTLDYVGNSHNLWHVCTMLSAFCNVLAVYYDCVEYDLVLCPS